MEPPPLAFRMAASSWGTKSRKKEEKKATKRKNPMIFEIFWPPKRSGRRVTRPNQKMIKGTMKAGILPTRFFIKPARDAPKEPAEPTRPSRVKTEKIMMAIEKISRQVSGPSPSVQSNTKLPHSSSRWYHFGLVCLCFGYLRFLPKFPLFREDCPPNRIDTVYAKT